MTALELCSDIVLAESARALLQENMTPEEFVDALIGSQQFPEAVTVLSSILSPRDRVWWACYCARQCPDFNSSPLLENAVAAAEVWVAEGGEPSRYRAFEQAQLAPLGSAANGVAMAAFTSTGSMAPVDAEALVPPASLSAQLAAGAVIVASIAEGAEHARRRYEFFLTQGKELAHMEGQTAA